MNIVELLGLGATAASGGLFGVLGAAFGGWMKLKERKQKAEEDIAKRAHDLQMVQLQMSSQSQAGSWASLNTSLESEAALNRQENYKWVIGVKALFRPFLTIILWVFVFVQLHLILTGVMQDYLKLASNGTILNLEEVLAIVRYIIYSTVFSATTATTWWFGERAISSPEMKNR